MIRVFRTVYRLLMSILFIMLWKRAIKIERLNKLPAE